MLTRRLFVASAGAAVIAPPALAQLRTDTTALGRTPYKAAGPGQTPWRNIGVQPVKRIVGMGGRESRRARVLEELMKDGKTPEHIKPVLRQLITTAPAHDVISFGHQSGRMGFASSDYRGIVVLDNVVAETDQPGWRGKSTAMLTWKYHDTAANRLYEVSEPEECENLLLSIYHLGECIKDEILCARWCEEMRKLKKAISTT